MVLSEHALLLPKNTLNEESRTVAIALRLPPQDQLQSRGVRKLSCLYARRKRATSTFKHISVLSSGMLGTTHVFHAPDLSITTLWFAEPVEASVWWLLGKI